MQVDMKIITVIDTGISEDYKEKFLSGRVLRTITYELVDGNLIETMGANDTIGHGTLVCSAINSINNHVCYNIIKACGENFWADEDALISILQRFADSDIETDILHISCGIQHCERKKDLDDVLRKIRKKGILIVSAFSNDYIISYPAACDNVIGVMYDKTIISSQEWIYVENSPINIFASGHIKSLVDKYGASVKTAGASICAAFMTGHIAKMLENHSVDEIDQELKKKAIRCYKAPDIYKQQQEFNCKKMVLFPFNKENTSLLRGYKMLNPQIVGILDTKYSRNVGKNAFKILLENEHYFEDNDELPDIVIQDIEKFDWNSDFDTFVLGHMEYLNMLLPKNLYDYIYSKCLEFHKNLYSYDIIPDNVCESFKKEGLCAFYPKMDYSNINQVHCGMLFEIGKPVVGVFGTSSKQGKWSLQIKLREVFEKRGYKTGHLGTEPQTLLFKNTRMCAIGYNSHVKVSQGSAIAEFNYMMNELQDSNDIIFFGTQSGVIPIYFGGLPLMPAYTNEMILACEPQASILCINEWDDIGYIRRCIRYLESFNENQVIALAYYKKASYEIWGIHNMSICENNQNRIAEIENEVGIHVYDMDKMESIENLCDEIIAYF